MFEPFGHARDIPSEYRELQGEGLSLYQCKSLCEEVGGGILAESKSGLGSTFTFYLYAEEVIAEVDQDMEESDIQSKRL